MSEVNCEQEDWEQHPLASQATYTEVLLVPGDCLYIPAPT
jgi:ribosomal protein L16 Arg81 hydroxylase